MAAGGGWRLHRLNVGIRFGVATKQVFITFYLSMASVALAALIQRDPVRHVSLIMNAYLLAAVVATIAALIGYFNLVASAH